MARTQHLPIYSATFALVREIYRIRIKLPKVLKHDLGQETFQSALKILKCVVLANRAQDKRRHITRLLLEIEVQWAMLRLLYELKGISTGERIGETKALLPHLRRRYGSSWAASEDIRTAFSLLFSQLGRFPVQTCWLNHPPMARSWLPRS